MTNKLIEERQQEQHILEAVKGVDAAQLDAYVDAINAVNARVPNDVRYLLRHRDAAIAVKVIKQRDTLDSHMPLVMHSSEHATCVETLQWLKTYGQVEGEALKNLSERLTSVLKEAKEEARPAIQEAYDSVRALEALHASLGPKLKEVAGQAAELQPRLSKRKGI